MKLHPTLLLFFIHWVAASAWIPVAADVSIASDNQSSIQLETTPLVLPPVPIKPTPSPSSSALKEEKQQLKAMQINALVQRAWISSTVLPGLGQVYNKQYWKIPCFYLGFFITGYMIHGEHKEMNLHKRNKLMHAAPTCTDLEKQNLPRTEFTDKRIRECKRTRNLFILIAAAWYLLNILDAYAGAHGTTVDFGDDIDTMPPAVQPQTLQTELGMAAPAPSMMQISIPIRLQ
ncbi:MAG TPA: DUF5683 domain-containing protein [Amoebophilaceae bacterium]|nr:DUF5683 domain-containing protein [Amoebophilaceae bacterium]